MAEQCRLRLLMMGDTLSLVKITCENHVFMTKDQHIDIPIGVNCTMIFRPNGNYYSSRKLAEFKNGQTVWCDF